MDEDTVLIFGNSQQRIRNFVRHSEYAYSHSLLNKHLVFVTDLYNAYGYSNPYILMLEGWHHSYADEKIYGLIIPMLARGGELLGFAHAIDAYEPGLYHRLINPTLPEKYEKIHIFGNIKDRFLLMDIN